MKIELKPITATSRLIYIDGVKVGIVDKEKTRSANTIDSRNNWSVSWNGQFTWDGERLSFYNVTSVTKIAERIEREIRVYERKKAEREANPIEEDGFLGRIADKAKQNVKNARDRVMYAAGDDKSLGRLHHRLATAELFRYWQAYVGRKESAGNKTIGKAPTIGDLVAFLAQFGVKFNPEDLAKISVGEEPADQKPDEETAAEPSEPAAPEQPEKPGAMDKLKNLASKIVPRRKSADSPEVAAKKAALKAQMNKAAADDNIGESLTEDEAPAPILTRTFNPKVIFPKLADWFMDNGLMSVTRDGEVRTGSMTGAGPAKEEPEDEGKTTDSKEKLIKIGSQITPDGNYLDVKKLKERFQARRLDKADLNWLRKSISQPAELRQAVKSDPKTTKQVMDFLWAILGAIGQKDIGDQDPNVTASGVTVDINAMSEHLKEHGVTGSLIKTLQDNIESGENEAKMMKMLMSENDTAFDSAYGIIDAFLKSTVALKKEK